MLRNGIIQIIGRIFSAPRVVAPIDNSPLALTIFLANDKYWPMIAAPRFIRREVMELDSFKWHFKVAQKTAHPRFHLRIPDIDEDSLDLNQCFDQVRIDRWNRVVFA